MARESGACFFFKYWIPSEQGGPFIKKRAFLPWLNKAGRLLRMAQGSRRSPPPCSIHHSGIGLGGAAEAKTFAWTTVSGVTPPKKNQPLKYSFEEKIALDKAKTYFQPQ